jgi:hypothetical protein
VQHTGSLQDPIVHAVLVEMATGHRAFPKPFDWGSPRVQDVPASLQPLVTKLLDPDPDLRYQTAGDLEADLKRVQRRMERVGGVRLPRGHRTADGCT